MVQVGKALCDIDVQSDITPEDEPVLTPPAQQVGSPNEAQQPQKAAAQFSEQREASRLTNEGQDGPVQPPAVEPPSATPNGKHSKLATPAVRGLLKDLDIDISQVFGTGRDGRVLKEDVHRHNASLQPVSIHTKHPTLVSPSSEQVEETIKLTPMQAQMFKTMSRSLAIPHFLYTDEIDITSLAALRRRLNAPPNQGRLSYLPFIIKAVSIALLDFPLLNARIDTTSSETPQLVMRDVHNIGVAMDTAQGLIVPNIKNVQAQSIASIASEIIRLHDLARSGKLSVKDLTGGTITVSNIGSIGGTYVSPIIANQNEIAILGIGKVRTVPGFGVHGDVVKKEVCNLSWSADHRVIDGATVARMCERVRGLVEEPGKIMLGLT